MPEPRRAIPSVEKLLQALDERELPRALVLSRIRAKLAAWRDSGSAPEFTEVLAELRASLDSARLARLRTVINATGILAHTNLGRAPLASIAADRVRDAAAYYCNLEADLETGERGRRGSYAEELAALVCEAEAATVVNNCAAALLLALRHFTREKPEVIISRGELVQIGGGFRIPEILEASGARLREVGTTNRTTLQDYAAVISPSTGLILKVHQSNFYMGGFVEFPGTKELAGLARQRAIPFVEDLGSGALRDTARVAGLEHERTPSEAVADGADLVCFSGDKLLGGPQAGIIAGREGLVDRLKREPFFRALRCDKLVLAALEATLELYLKEAVVPLWEMLTAPVESLRARAERITAELKSPRFEASVGHGESQVGGGTLPKSALRSITVDLRVKGSLDAFARRLRTGSPPVIGYIAQEQLKLDLRTVLPTQDTLLIQALQAAG